MARLATAPACVAAGRVASALPFAGRCVRCGYERRCPPGRQRVQQDSPAPFRETRHGYTVCFSHLTGSGCIFYMGNAHSPQISAGSLRAARGDFAATAARTHTPLPCKKSTGFGAPSCLPAVLPTCNHVLRFCTCGHNYSAKSGVQMYAYCEFANLLGGYSHRSRPHSRYRRRFHDLHTPARPTRPSRHDICTVCTCREGCLLVIEQPIAYQIDKPGITRVHGKLCWDCRPTCLQYKKLTIYDSGAAELHVVSVIEMINVR